MRKDDCRRLLCLQQNFAKMLKLRVQAVVTASCYSSVGDGDDDDDDDYGAFVMVVMIMKTILVMEVMMTLAFRHGI